MKSLTGRLLAWAFVVMASSVAGVVAPSDPAPSKPGRALAEAACQSCHAMPDPGLLDQRTWQQETLKAMSPWLGMSRIPFERQPDGEILRAAHVFPDAPVFTLEEWRLVAAYFASNAPAEPPPQRARPRIAEGLPGFRVEPLILGTNLPFTTLVQVDPERKRLWVGDGQDRSLRALDSSGRVVWRLPVPSGPVGLVHHGDSVLVTLIGRVFPSDELAGQLWSVPLSGERAGVVRLLEGLRRPVHTTVADLDQDGIEDLIVSAFGNRLGQLSWFKSRADGRLVEHVLEEYPGTLRTIPTDWNGDGRTDLLVVRAQAREGVTVLLNDGDGGFQPRVILEQQPSFGTVALELADLDRDGRDEFLVVNGDSGDYASPHKAFHGLRVYGRTSEGMLRERYFFPMHGAYGVRARDFDGDGDLDLALISFFPDATARPLETFVLLRNQGAMNFEAFALPEADAIRGRWLVMDAGDLDGDGDEDIVLGSFFRGPPTVPIPPEWVRGWESNRVSVMVLRNLRRP